MCPEAGGGALEGDEPDVAVEGLVFDVDAERAFDEAADVEEAQAAFVLFVGVVGAVVQPESRSQGTLPEIDGSVAQRSSIGDRVGVSWRVGQPAAVGRPRRRRPEASLSFWHGSTPIRTRPRQLPQPGPEGL